MWMGKDCDWGSMGRMEGKEWKEWGWDQFLY